MEEILHRLKPLNYCTSWDFRDSMWCRISSINGIMLVVCGLCCLCLFSLFFAVGMRRHSKKSEAKHFSDPPNRDNIKVINA